ncbi:hypothetical protein INT45_006931 [Circinella minor]|uniref:Uncharacterized protein n=1 Tax=Circinella minor TaxID=1195481 RepID=A0A8H7RT58_9FUNG|nr:hypothetical protein INT45_006931 [Circinella minor]
MSNHQKNSAAPTVSDVAVHIEDDMISETGSVASTSVSSQVPPRIAKLIAKLSFLEEEMVRSDLSEEQIVQIQKSYAIYSKSLDMMLAVQKKLSKKDKAVSTTTSSSRSIVPSDLPALQ